MNYQQKLDAALVLVNEYNEAVGVKSPQWVNSEKFITNLKALGAVNEADLDSLKWEQVLKCLEHAQGGPSAMPPQKLAEKIAAIITSNTAQALPIVFLCSSFINFKSTLWAFIRSFNS